MKTDFLFIFIIFCSSLFSACSSHTEGSDMPKETTTSGHVKIAIDQSLRAVMSEELKVFDSSFPKADIEETYQSENDCFRDFFNDSVAMIIVTRDLTKKERKLLTKNKLRIRSMPLAMGAIALIVNPQSPDTLMTTSQLESILDNSFVRQYNIVFNGQESGTMRYFSDSLIAGEDLPANIYALNNSDSVLSYVAHHKNSLGILGAINIYQDVDTGAGTFKSNIKVVALRNDFNFKFYQPYQAFVAMRAYPLTRPIYFISRETWQGLATGFANFLAGQRGQLIFKHAWMAPLRVPLRIRQVNLVE